MATTLPRPLMVPRDALRPPSADRAGTGLVASLLAHALLIGALALGVSWHNQEPEGVTAELWAATPQIAAPPRVQPTPGEEAMPPPPPPPIRPITRPAPPPRPAPEAAAEREAQIAIEKAQRERQKKAQEREAEQKKLEQQRAEKLEAERQKAQKQKAQKLQAQQDKAEQARQEAAREKADAAQREKLRQDQMRRMSEQLGGGPSGNGAPTSTGKAARDAGPSAGYEGRIKARIKPNIVFSDDVNGNPTAEVEVRVAPDGSIIGRRITRHSGVPAWDDAVLRAIDRTAILPRDTNGSVPPVMIIQFQPRE